MGVYLDQLMIGLSAEDGSFLFSGGNGIINKRWDQPVRFVQTPCGCMQAIKIWPAPCRTDSETWRCSCPDGAQIPSLALTYKDDASSNNIIPNGSFEDGTLANWTDSGSGFSALSDIGPTGYEKYVLHFGENTSTPETLTSDPINITGGTNYAISVITRDVYEEQTAPCIANVNLDQQIPTFPYGSVPDASGGKSFLGIGNYLGNLHQNALLKFDFSQITLNNLYSAALTYFLKKTRQTPSDQPSWISEGP